MFWKKYVTAFTACMHALQTSKTEGQAMGVEEAFALWHEITVRLRDGQGTVYLAGNGASATMAAHFAADLFKNGGIRTQLFTDSALLTAVGNDVSFEQIYSLPLERCARANDMLVAISSSGQSPNILNAAQVAQCKQVAVVTLTGFSSDNTLRTLGDINFYAPANTYGLVESCHAAILHCWMDGLI